MKYEILVSFNLNKVLPSVGGVVGELNQHMNGFGFPEQISLRSERVPMAVITIDKNLTVEESQKIAIIYAQNFEKQFPESNPEVTVVPQCP